MLVRGFLPPFAVTFFIAIFVLVVQMLWNYIDDIIGKGAGLLFILEMVFYLSISLIPMALPIAVLISSVMVMGNLAERFELTSLKSAGIPLLRVMRPLLMVTILISIFSYFTGNNLMPLSNLKFRKRLSEVKNQKPTLSLEEGVFNEDFSELVIHIGEKEPDNRTIREVMIYDQRKNSRGQVSQVLAREGEMYTSEDGQFFFLHLTDGEQYEEMTTERRVTRTGQAQPLPFVRTRFREWERVFDLSEFDIREIDEERFQSHYSMMTSAQLLDAIDTLQVELDSKQEQFEKTTARFFHPLNRLLRDSTFAEQFVSEPLTIQGDKAPSPTASEPGADTVRPEGDSATEIQEQIGRQSNDEGGQTFLSDSLAAPAGGGLENAKADTVRSFIEWFDGAQREQMFTRAKSATRSLVGTAQATLSQTNTIFERRVKSIFEFHLKFTMPLVCVIFLFIGAPLGAIVRKGGFGYPILIAIVFFTIFVIMNIGFKNMAEEEVLHPVFGAWLPLMILFPIGLFLTTKAMNDTKLLDFSRIFYLLSRLSAHKQSGSQTQSGGTVDAPAP